ncbi:hypothetical protein ACRALDRAFT_2060709 [Sodiomyces alcalophilus JCM 7366]|uniref:uncharacterized protein n=1 Tax=Sodiomyces alcalophilus JCM 7366 TaxID=591952 RepID=UPI0039B606E5
MHRPSFNVCVDSLDWTMCLTTLARPTHAATYPESPSWMATNGGRVELVGPQTPGSSVELTAGGSLIRSIIV